MLFVLVLIGCGANAPQPAADPAPPTVPDEQPAPPSVATTASQPDAGPGRAPMLEPFSRVRLHGMCEPSAAILGERGLWFAEDDGLDYLLTAPATPEATSAVQRVALTHLGAPLKLDDLEGAARQGDEVWWTTSISRSREGRTLMAWSEGLSGETAGLVNLISWRDPGAFEGLVRARAPECDLPDDLHERRPKRGGLDIEGLALSGDAMYLGLRGPVSVGGQRAVVVQVDRAAAKAGASVDTLITGAWCIDLAGQGIRSLTADPRVEGGFLGIAGDVASGGDFWLFSWVPGQEPLRVGQIPTEPDTSPEALVVWMEGERLVGRIGFDEGTRTERETGCPCDQVLAGQCEGHAPESAFARLGLFQLPE